jgi:hypothetical protein
VSTAYTQTGGGVIAFTDPDDATKAIALPWAVPYYGSSYTTAHVSTNGFLCFTAPAQSYPTGKTALPNPALPNNCVYPFWDDLTTAAGDVRVQYTGTAPNRQMTIEWRTARRWAEGNDQLDFEVIFTEAGQISFRYQNIDPARLEERGAAAAVGVEDPTGTLGLQHSYLQPSLVNGTAVVFTPPAPTPPPGTVTPGGLLLSHTYANGGVETNTYNIKSRGAAISTGPTSVITVLDLVPLRELPPVRPAGACLP